MSIKSELKVFERKVSNWWDDFSDDIQEELWDPIKAEMKDFFGEYYDEAKLVGQIVASYYLGNWIGGQVAWNDKTLATRGGDFLENIWGGIRNDAMVEGGGGGLQYLAHGAGQALAWGTEEGRILRTGANTIGAAQADGDWFGTLMSGGSSPYVPATGGEAAGFDWKKFAGQLGSGASMYYQYELARNAQKFANQQLQIAREPTPAQRRLRRDLNMMDAIASTPTSQLTNKFGTTTLMRYGITPSLVEAEALQSRADRRREVESIEDEAGRMAARSGMFGQGSVAALKQQVAGQAVTQDAALALAAEQTFANQMASLQQQYQSGTIQSMNMDAAQQAQIAQAMGLQAQANASMNQFWGDLGQTMYERWGQGDPKSTDKKKYTNKEAMDLYQKGEWTQDQWKDWYIGTYGQSEWDKFKT